ncbi:MAG: hypothetical protein AAGP08_04585 [Pseudomonadota bacterium]
MIGIWAQRGVPFLKEIALHLAFVRFVQAYRSASHRFDALAIAYPTTSASQIEAIRNADPVLQDARARLRRSWMITGFLYCFMLLALRFAAPEVFTISEHPLAETDP